MTVEMGARASNRVVCWVAAANYAGATLLGVVESLLPGGQSLTLAPIGVALVMCALTLTVGPRLPRPALFVLGPIGATAIAAALATTKGYGDGAILYVWPVLWCAYFFGNRANAFMVAWIAFVQAIALMAMPAGQGNADSWLDVVVTMLIVTAVVRALVVQNERTLEALAAEARIDPLTGVLNRRGLHERLAGELEHAAREQTFVAVVLLDLDHFKAINDRHGHETGDRVLSWLGALLAEQVRGIDIVARAGGEEFVVVLPGQNLEAAHAFAERVRERLGEGEALAMRRELAIDAALELTVSSGVAAELAPTDGEALIGAADRAMYRAKRAGRNRVVDADEPDMLPVAA
jgi:diguanylate cyclase (GGDEF)-like protein